MRATRAQRITDLYDPESLITGAEVEAGFTYDNSYRRGATRSMAAGLYYPEEIVNIAPRVLKPQPKNLSYLEETTSFLP